MRLNRLLASFCLLVATFGLASSQPSPGGKGPRTIRERSEALKVDLKEPPAGLVRNPQFYTKSTDENVPLYYTLDGDTSWVWCGANGEDAGSGIALDSGTDRNCLLETSPSKTTSTLVSYSNRMKLSSEL